MDGFIDEGLDAPYDDPEESKILVVGACIKLLIHDSGTDQEEPLEVVEKLKAQKTTE